MATTPIDAAIDAVKESELEAATKEVFTTSHNQQLTYGPVDNNLSGDYRAGNGIWDINFCNKISSDVVLIHLSKMSQLYRKVGSPTLTGPIPRDIKDILLKDKFPVRTMGDM